MVESAISLEGGAKAGALAETGRLRLLCLPRRADQPSGHRGIPPPCRHSLEASTQAPRPERSDELAADWQTSRGLPTPSPHRSSLARRTLRRQTPEVRAECLSRARSDLCGGAQKCASLPRSLFAAPTVLSQGAEYSLREPS